MEGGMIAWYTRQGGKNYLRKRLIKLFPKENEYTTYIEPFFGAGWMFFEKDRSPKEVINDLDKIIYYAQKDIQKVSPDDIRAMNFRPSKTRFNTLKQSNPTNPVDRLYKFLYLKWYSFCGNMTTFALLFKHQKETLIRRLAEIQERLKGVTILNKDYKYVILKYDSPSSFFYLDPPYIDVSTKEYTHKTIDINELVHLLSNLKGRFMLSYNDHPEIRKAFKHFYIREINQVYRMGAVKKPVVELIITNY